MSRSAGPISVPRPTEVAVQPVAAKPTVDPAPSSARYTAGEAKVAGKTGWSGAALMIVILGVLAATAFWFFRMRETGSPQPEALKKEAGPVRPAPAATAESPLVTTGVYVKARPGTKLTLVDKQGVNQIEGAVGQSGSVYISGRLLPGRYRIRAEHIDLPGAEEQSSELAEGSAKTVTFRR